MGRTRKTDKHLPPSVYKKHGAFYYVKDNVWQRIGTSLEEVHRFYADRVVTTASLGGIDPFIDASFARMKSRKVDPLALNTVKQYELAAKKLKHLLRQFGSPQQVKQREAAQIKVLLAATPNMANRVLSFARQVFADLVEQQVVDSNPFLGIRRHKEARRTRTYTKPEWDSIYGHAGPRLRVIMDLLFLTDQRIGDVLKIDLRHLLDEGIYFKQQKTGKELIVRWNDELRQVVARARQLHGSVEPVNFSDKKIRPLLRNRRGKAPDYRTIALQWRNACDLAGVEDSHIHDVRAMSTTAAKRQGIDPQRIAGHEDARTTKIYLRGLEVDVVDGPKMNRQ